MTRMTPPIGRIRRRRLAGAAAAALLAAAPALAQDSGGRKHLTLVGLPSGTVAPHGTVFASLALTNRRTGIGPAIRDNDGSLALGFGLGSAEETIGFQFTMDITSLSRSFGDAGSFGIKVSRRLAAGDWPVYASLGADYLAPWGSVRVRKPAVTAALTTFGQITLGGDSYPVMATIGGGNRVRANYTRPGAFVGFGIGVTENLAASLAWTGESLDLGLGLRIPALEPVTFTLAVNDATDRLNSRRVTATATWAFNAFGR